MNGIEQLFLTDKTAETEGELFPMEDTEMRFRIARFGNARFTAALERRREARRKSLGLRANKEVTLTDEEFAAAMAEGILTGWEKVPDGNGGELPYSVETAEKMLGMRDFANWVSARAANQENYRVATLLERAEALGKG